MRLLPATLFLCLTYSLLAAQPIAIETETLAGPEWYRGSIVLNSGEELDGLLKYNDKNDIVSFESGRDSRSFTARSVKTFEFYDELMEKRRKFLTVPVIDRKHDVTRPLFFEVLMDLDNFAILSKVSPVRVDKREYSTPAIFNPGTGSYSAGRYYGYPSTVSQTETLFILHRNGAVKPYLQIIEKEIDGMFFDRSITKNKVLDDELLKKLTSPYFAKLESYARQNALNFSEKQDLMSILHYYNELSH